MEKYVITLRNDKVKTYAVISWLIVILNFAALLYFGISRPLKTISFPFIVATLLVLFFLFLLTTRKDSKIAVNKFRIFYSILILGWIIVPFYWAAAINFLLFMIQETSGRGLFVKFFEDKVIYPSFPQKTILWEQLNNVILKDGILTIDCKNNRIYQNEIISEINEAGFNEFCSHQLRSFAAN